MKDVHKGTKILLVFMENLHSPRKGNERRVHDIIRTLSQFQSIQLITLESKEYIAEKTMFYIKKRYYFNPMRKILRTLGKFTFLSFNPFYLFSFIKIIKEEQPDVIQIEYPYGILPYLLLERKSKPKLIYSAHDVEHLRILSIHNGHFCILKPIELVLSLICEKLATKYAYLVISISYEDKIKFANLYHIPLDKIVSILPTIKYRDALKLNRNILNIVFHGTYKYFPNQEAIREIVEYISLSVPYKNVNFLIAGTGSPKKKKNNNVIFLGYVPDLSILLKNSDIAIVPLRRGGGIKIKVLDYLAYGLPIVITKKGAEGLDLVNGKHAIVVDGVNEEFIKAINHLIENPKIRKKLRHNARKLFEKRYSEENIKKKISKILENLTSK